MSVTYVLSESDLLLLDDYEPGLEATNPQKLAKILWTNGMDVKDHRVEIDDNQTLHRNLQKQIVSSKRYVGMERTDMAWRQTGKISTEALIASSTDKGFRKELCGMAAVAKA